MFQWISTEWAALNRKLNTLKHHWRITLGMLLILPLVGNFGYTCSPVPPRPILIYMPVDEFRAAVQITAPESVINPSNFSLHNDFLYVIEGTRGIHIIDNSVNTNPLTVAFIDIPFVTQITLVGNFLYAASGIDLLVFDISDPANPLEGERATDIFPNDARTEDWSAPLIVDDSQGVVVGIRYEQYSDSGSCGGGGCSSASSDSSYISSSGSLDGSMSAMNSIGDHLFVVAGSELLSINISTPAQPTVSGSLEVGSNPETVYSNSGTIYVGAMSGMSTVDVSDPYNMIIAGSFDHEWRCDPVIVNDGIAYVTTRRCGSFGGQLDILSVSDITNPVLLSSSQLNYAAGLSLHNNTLFVAALYSGVIVVDVTDPAQVVFLDGIDSQVYPEDVLTVNGVAIVRGADGLEWYDISDLNDIQLLSTL